MVFEQKNHMIQMSMASPFPRTTTMRGSPQFGASSKPRVCQPHVWEDQPHLRKKKKHYVSGDAFHNQNLFWIPRHNIMGMDVVDSQEHLAKQCQSDGTLQPGVLRKTKKHKVF